jgi:uncharacterized repeat protein (TIGR01451 family)
MAGLRRGTGAVAVFCTLVALAGLRPGGAEAAEVADFGVVVTAAPHPVAAGADLTYLIEVSTEGPDDAADVTLSDPLPPGTTFRSLAAPGGWTCATPAVGQGGTVTCSIASLPPSTAFFSLVVATDPGLTDPLANTATVTSATADPNPGNESGQALTPVFALADLAVAVTAAPAPAIAGADLVYSITLANHGPSTGRDVTLTGPLPPEAVFRSLAAPAGWSCATPAAGAPGSLSCARAALPPGSEVLTLRVGVDPAAEGPLVAGPGVAGATLDPDPANDAAEATTAVLARTDLGVQLSAGSDPALAGDLLRYEVRVSGGGPSAARDVRVVAPLPDGTALEAVAPPAGWACAGPAPGQPAVVACETARLGPGTETLGLVVKVHPAAGPVLRVTAEASAASDDPAPGNETATLALPVEPPARRVVVAPGPGAPPLVRVYDVNALAELGAILAGPAGFTGGVRVAAGDVSGDGVPDVVAGAGPGGGGRAVVLDGTTGAVLLDLLPFGPAFAAGIFVAAGDVDGDGRADLVVGADAGGPPGVRVLSGATGAELSAFEAFPSGFTGGVRVAVGDVDGDGGPDLIAAAGPGGPAEIRVFDGTGATLLRSVFPYGPAYAGGLFVAAGDLDGDGRADLVAGPDQGLVPQVRVVSGATGDDLLAFPTFALPFAAGVRVAAGDVNRDGVPDLIAGTGPGTPADVWIHDGRTGARLGTFQPFPPGWSGGVFVGAAPAARSHAEVRFLAPPAGTAVRAGEALEVTWTSLPGASGYAVEVRGPGLGEAGLRVEVAAARLEAVVPPGTPPGDYQLRVVALGPGGQPLGRPSEPLGIAVE